MPVPEIALRELQQLARDTAVGHSQMSAGGALAPLHARTAPQQMEVSSNRDEQVQTPLAEPGAT